MCGFVLRSVFLILLFVHCSWLLCWCVAMQFVIDPCSLCVLCFHFWCLLVVLGFCSWTFSCCRYCSLLLICYSIVDVVLIICLLFLMCSWVFVYIVVIGLCSLVLLHWICSLSFALVLLVDFVFVRCPLFWCPCCVRVFVCVFLVWYCSCFGFAT